MTASTRSPCTNPFDEQLADVALPVGALVAAAPGDRAGVQHHRHAPVRTERSQHVLHPAPVGAGAGRDAPAEAVVGVVLVHAGGEVLVPHGIGGHQVEPAQAAVLLGETGVAHGVAQGDLGVDVVDEGVHARHGEGGGVDLLPEDLERGDWWMASTLCPIVPGLPVGLQQPQVALDEQAARAAGGVVDGHARLRVQQVCHQHADLARRVELAGALSLTLGELAQQVLVGPAQDIRLDILQAQAVLVEHLDQLVQVVIADDALAGGGGVEVGHVDHACQLGVLAGDGPHGVGEGFAQADLDCCARCDQRDLGGM